MEHPRLTDDQLDDFERALLRSARVDEPDVQAAARAAVVLGIGASAITVAAGSAVAKSATAVSSGVTPLSNLMVYAVVKWLGLGIVAGLVTTGGIELAQNLTRPAPRAAEIGVSSAPPPARPLLTPARSSPPVRESAAPAPRAAFPAVVSPPSSKLDTGLASTSAPSTRSGAAVVSPVPATPVPSTQREQPIAAFAEAPSAARVDPPPVSSIAEEVAALGRARRHLAAGDAGRALDELDRYDRNVRVRALGAEAAVLRVEALLRAGRRAEAVGLAQSLLATQPHGPHAARLRRLAGLSPR